MEARLKQLKLDHTSLLRSQARDEHDCIMELTGTCPTCESFIDIREEIENEILQLTQDLKEELEFMRGYEEAQSRLRLSMTCKSMVRPLAYPLQARIVELAGAFRSPAFKGWCS